MKKIFFSAAAVLCLIACKKEMHSDDTQIDGISSSQRGNPAACVSPLILVSPGVYQTNFQGVTVTVTNVQYPLYDNWGRPMPARNGDPAFGSISVPSNAGQYVLRQPDVPDNHLAIGQLVWAAPNNTINYSGYNNEMYSYRILYAAYVAGLNIGSSTTSPPDRPLLSQFITTGAATGGNGQMVITGKLIRMSTGTQFAIACEDYPELPPIEPPFVPCNPCNEQKTSVNK